MQSASRLAAGSPESDPRRARRLPSLPALSVASVIAIALALALVFFYAPLEADQGFLQKIFYLHVPMAIVALAGFVIGGLLAIQHLRTREARWDVRSYV